MVKNVNEQYTKVIRDTSCFILIFVLIDKGDHYYIFKFGEGPSQYKKNQNSKK